MAVRSDRAESSLLAVRGSALSLAGTACGALANFAMLALIGNHFGPRAFGVFSGATASFLLAAVVFRLGGDTGSTWFVAQLVEDGRVRSARQALRIAVTPVVVSSVAAAGLALLLAPTLATQLTDAAGEDDYTSLIRIFAVALPVATVGEVVMGATRGLGSMRPTVLASQIGRQVGQLITVVVALALGGDLTDVGVAWALPYLITVLYPGLWLRGRLPRHGRLELVDGDRYWRYTIPQAANSTAQTGLEKFDVIALGFLAGATAQGEYSVANRMAHVVVLGWYAINLAQTPVYARLFASGRDLELRQVVQTVSGWAVIAVAPILWVYLVFASVVARLFGPEFERGGDALTILAAALLIALLMGPAENLLLMSGRSSRAFANNLIALAANVALNLILVPDHGIEGAAVAWLVALLFTRGSAAVQVASQRGVFALGRPLIECWVAAGLCFGGVGALARWALGATVAALIVTVVVGAVLLVVVVLVRREAMRVDTLLGAVTGGRPRGGAAPDARLELADPDRLALAPHLRLTLRSATVVAQDAPAAVRRRAVIAVQAVGWKGRLVRATIGRLFVALPGRAPALLPRVTRTRGAELAVPAELAAEAVSDALDRLADPLAARVDGIAWLVPPASDGARASALLLSAGEPVVHLRLSGDLAAARPSPATTRGERTGIEWPIILDSWRCGEMEIEVSTVIDLGPHVATELDLATLLELVDDLQDTLGGGIGPRWTTPLHGDLTPWNLRSAGDRVALFDWEHRCFGPRDGDLVRYVSTASNGLALFEQLPAARRQGAGDAIRWCSEVAATRVERAAASAGRTRWKQRDQAEEITRLARLAELAR